MIEKKEINTRIKELIRTGLQELVLTGLSHKQFLDKIKSFNGDKRLSKILAIVYGESKFPDSEKIQTRARDCNGNMADRMLYITIKPYCQEIISHKKQTGLSQPKHSTSNYSQPSV